MPRSEKLILGCTAAVILTIVACTAVGLRSATAIERTVAAIEFRTLTREQQIRRLGLQPEDLRARDLDEWMEDFAESLRGR
jgi:hypothetical protein